MGLPYLKDLHPIFNSVFGSLESHVLSYLYILDISPLSDVVFVKVFSKLVGCHFVLLKMSFALQELCNYMRLHFSILDLRA